MDFYKRALELKDETVADRRYIHQNAETGLELPKTKAYVMDKLKEYGLDPVECGEGVTATLGNGGRVLLLRADMDGLPMPEESGEAFACPTGKTAHTCGHFECGKNLKRTGKQVERNCEIHVPAGGRDISGK